MSTPHDPHGGDRDWGRPPAGGWGAVGPSDPTADPPTPAFGTPAVEPDADPGVHGTQETPRYGWDAAQGDQGTPGGWADDRAAGWSAGGASDWERGGTANAWDQQAPVTGGQGQTGGWAAGDAGQAGRAPEAGYASGRHPDAQAAGGWDSAPGAGQTAAWGGQDTTAQTAGGWGADTAHGASGGWAGQGQDSGGPVGWDPRTGQGGGVPQGRDAGSPGGWDPRTGSAESAAAATTALAAAGTKAGKAGKAGNRIRLPLVIGGVVGVLVVAAVLVLGFWRPGFLVTQEFDQQALQTGVTQILTQDYGLEVTALTCPDGQRVAAGESFTCAATVDGENVDVPITVLDDQGTYQVGRV